MSDETPPAAAAPEPEDDRMKERLLDAVQSIADNLRTIRFQMPRKEPKKPDHGIWIEIRLKARWHGGHARTVRRLKSPPDGEMGIEELANEAGMKKVGEKLQLVAAHILEGNHIVVLPEFLYMECPSCKGAPPTTLQDLCSHCRGVGLVTKPPEAFMGVAGIVDAGPGFLAGYDEAAKVNAGPDYI